MGARTKNKVININSWRFQIKGKTIIFYGERTENGPIHEIRIELPSISYIQYLGEACIESLRKEFNKIGKMITSVKNT